MKRCTDLLTLYFPQPCLEKSGPFAEIRPVVSYRKDRISLSHGNVNLTDCWYTMLAVFLEQDMSYTCQHIDLLSDEDPGWWDTQIEKKREWICLSFIKLNLENDGYRTAEARLKERIGSSKRFRTFGNADFIFAFSNESEEEMQKNLESIKEINLSGREETDKPVFFSNYHLYGQCETVGEGSDKLYRIATYHIDNGGGCQTHKLYGGGWSGRTIEELCGHIRRDKLKKNKKMMAYYQGVGQILNIIAQYEQPEIFKDLFFMFYPPIALFMRQLVRAEQGIESYRETAQDPQKDDRTRSGAKEEKYQKMMKMERSISEFIDSMEVLLHHMGHSCRDILSDAGRGGIPYDIPIRLCLMYTAYLHVLTDVLNDEKYHFEYCLAPLAYSRPLTKCLDFGLPHGDRLIEVRISRHTMFMPRTLLIILAHEASHYVSNFSRSRKLRAECFVKIANLAVVHYLLPSNTLCSLDIEENDVLNNYLEELRRYIYDYLCDSAWKIWADKEEDSTIFYFDEFYESLKMKYSLLMEGADQRLPWNLERIDHGTIESLRKKEGSENLFRDILQIQDNIRAARMILWDRTPLKDFLDSVVNNMKEVYADICAILLLELSPDDFLESYIIAEGYVPEEDVISSVLINRIAMVKYVLQEDRSDWKDWEPSGWPDQEKGRQPSAVEAFLHKLKAQTDDYIRRYIEEVEYEGKEEGNPGSSVPDDRNKSHAPDELFDYIDVLNAESSYFTECYRRIKEYLKNQEINGKKYGGRTHQTLLRNLFRHFQNCPEGEETSYGEFFKDYEALIDCYKNDVRVDYQESVQSPGEAE